MTSHTISKSTLFSSLGSGYYTIHIVVVILSNSYTNSLDNDLMLKK